MNAEITYCYNFWQMYKNPSEIAALKKRVRSKVVVAKKTSQGTVFFRVQCFFLSQKLAAAIHSTMDKVFL